MITRVVLVVAAVAGLVVLWGDLRVARDVSRAVSLGEDGQVEASARLLRSAAGRTQDTAPLVRLAQLELFQQRPERALGPARQVVAREPENAQAWLLVAQAAGRSGDAGLEARARARVAELVAQP